MQDPEKVIETVDCVMRCWIIICVIRKVPLVHYCLVSQTLSVPQRRSLSSDRRCGKGLTMDNIVHVVRVTCETNYYPVGLHVQ